MAKFYGTVQGARGKATRLGHSDLCVTAQSYDGSVIVNMHGDGLCRIGIGGGSTGYIEHMLYDGPIKGLFSDQVNFGGN